ncbi:MAG: hypothetical protein U5J98_02630 [Halobacteriales archaeon]|nr:hypothetical protein [Halobacteriales archaeon]
MNRFAVLGVALIVAGLGAYVIGLLNPYTGRAFSITLVMVGITLIAIRKAVGEADSS